MAIGHDLSIALKDSLFYFANIFYFAGSFLDEDAALLTCNLSKTIYNKWLQALGNNITNFYDATLDDYCRAALESTAYHNFLKCRGCGINSDSNVFKLQSMSQSGNPK